MSKVVRSNIEKNLDIELPKKGLDMNKYVNNDYA